MATLLTLRLPPNTLFGIDLLSLNTSKKFYGISGVPPGWHFVFTGATASLSIRHGFWFHVPVPVHGCLLVRIWDREKEELVAVEEAQELEDWRQRLIAEGGRWARENLMPFRQSAATTIPINTVATEDGLQSYNDSYYPALVRHISASLLSRITSATFTLLSTSCGAQDREHIPGLTAAEVATTLGTEKEAELVFLGIELQRTWREGAVGRERTEGARDRSWALSEVVRQSQIKFSRDEESTVGWGSEVLGEVEFCFLMTVLLANFSCLEEWKRILELVLTCQSIISEQEKFFCEFIRLLGQQLKRCEDVEGGLFDFSDDTSGGGAGAGGGFLRSLIQKFKRALDEAFSATEGEDIKREMKTLEGWLNEELGWELSDNFVRRGMLELEDGEQIEVEIGEMEGEDERGEFAPVVVDLGEQVV